MNAHSRREFLKRAAVLTGSAAAPGALAASIERARAIEPSAGSTFLDAEHVVILMQENRSFDHAFGALQGVRGFNDPRAVTLHNGNPVWVQTDDDGASYIPFRLNIKDSNATWMGCLPHSRSDQVDARNGGRYDRWLQAKRSGDKRYASMPLTLGYYTRDDIPFYYALADAFTICDQHFCSMLSCTTPNRVYLWTGAARDHSRADSPVRMLNSEIDHQTEVAWTTFPERLEDHGVSWKIYQNELYLETGLSGEEMHWLSNFGDNPIEHFSQFNLRYAASYRRHLAERVRTLQREIDELSDLAARGAANPKQSERLARLRGELDAALAGVERWSQANFERLAPRDRQLHARAFTVNDGDPHYRRLEELRYRDGDVERRLRAPKGDVLHQFRQDFASGKAPAVSWLVAPQAFSDHPDSAWFGAWYIAEALDVLTQNPDVWKKTIFILTYDENDGYFDHVPPFVAPHPRRADSGAVSAGIDAGLEYVELDDPLRERLGSEARDSSIGLGYRVPMIIASPWTRGGCVCSQVFDHTSTLQLLERWITHKTGRAIRETNISAWRRAVCGDLTSAFQSSREDVGAGVPVPERNKFLAGIHRAQFKPLPAGFDRLTADELAQMRRNPRACPRMARQEPGVRQSCPLPYELSVEGRLSADRSRFVMHLEAGAQAFGAAAAGAAFSVRAWIGPDEVAIRDYAVAAGSRVDDAWLLSDFAGRIYRLAVHGPNGFFREFCGSAHDPAFHVELTYAAAAGSGGKLSGDVVLRVANREAAKELALEVEDCSYGASPVQRVVAAGQVAEIVVPLDRSFGWYDLAVRVAGDDAFVARYAGRVETGAWTFSDPAMGGVA